MKDKNPLIVLALIVGAVVGGAACFVWFISELMNAMP